MRPILLDSKTVPRWVILCVDVLVVLFSFVLTYFVFSNLQLTFLQRRSFFTYTGIYVSVAALVLYAMRVHTGLLRYSNTRDMIRIFKATFVYNAIYVLIISAGFHDHGQGDPIRFISFLLINFFVSATLMIMMRVVAKGVFFSLAKRFEDRKTVRILIFGSDKNAVLLKQAMEANQEVHYVIEGFVGTDRKHLNNYMEQKRVYHIKDLPKLKKVKKIDELMLFNEQLDAREKKVVIERCLRLGIKVVTVPPVKKWLSGRLEKGQIQNLKIEDLLQRKPIRIDQTAVRKDLFNKRVLVTGAAGSIGAEIVRQVLTYHPELLILCDQAESPLHEIQLEIEEKFPESRIEIVLSDVRQFERMEKLFRMFRPQVIYHAAAYKHVPLMERSPVEAICVNVIGTRNIADLALRYKAEKFVMVSTDKAVNPTNVMGATKRIAEIYIQSLDQCHEEDSRQKGSLQQTRFITTRFGNVLGSNGSVIPRFRSQIEKGGPLTVTHPEITRYFMTIPEAVQLVLEAGTMGKGGEIYVFDMGKPVKIIDLARKMIQLAGLVEGKDIQIVFSGLRPGEKLFEELLSEEETTLPTHHEKIRVARVRRYAYAEVQQTIDELIDIHRTQENMDIVRVMKKLVPEFVSRNSPYEVLDQLPPQV